eukprot:3311693-Pleurochrysis_carterae.AAC.1
MEIRHRACVREISAASRGAQMQLYRVENQEHIAREMGVRACARAELRACARGLTFACLHAGVRLHLHLWACA